VTDTTVRVVFRRQISDGNYGSETAEIALEALVDDNDEVETQVRPGMLLAEARRLVHAELGHSPSQAVRRAVVARSPSPADLEDLPY